jgi:hypothetical protein
MSQDHIMVQCPPSMSERSEPRPKIPPPSYIRLLAMSVQLRINSLQDRRPNVKGNARQLLRSSEVPESPTTRGPVCEALEPEGRPCRVALSATAEDPWCHRHHHEWKDLNTRWSKTHKDAEKLVVINSETAKQKVMKLRLSIDLRRQIRDRFYPRGGDIQDYIKCVAKLETDVRQLADSLLSTSSLCNLYFHLTCNAVQNLNRGPTPETPAVSTPHPDSFNLEKIMILQSPLDPKIPIDSLHGMPDDGKRSVYKPFDTNADFALQTYRRDPSAQTLLLGSVRRQYPSIIYYRA